jgi:UDP-N-acetylglucosamine acyltransferase
MAIHPTAVVEPSAELAEGVEIGPYAIIGADVAIGEGTRVGPHVIVEGRTVIGRNCALHIGAALGGAPQDRKYGGEPTSLIIGDDNEIREYVTIHRGSGEGAETVIGDGNLLMAYSHIGHNCRIGSHIMLTNYAGISGHVIIEDRAGIGGMVGVHQFVRIGRLAMVGGYSKVAQDVPPFMLVDGRPARPIGLNVLGLRRAGVPPETRDSLKRAFRLLYRSNLNLSQALDRIVAEIQDSEYLGYLVEFMRRSGMAGRQLEHAGEDHL